MLNPLRPLRWRRNLLRFISPGDYRKHRLSPVYFEGVFPVSWREAAILSGETRLPACIPAKDICHYHFDSWNNRLRDL